MNYCEWKKWNRATKWFCALVVIGLAARASGQGLINFNNHVTSSTPPVDAKIYDGFTGPLIPISGTDLSYRAALLGGPTTGTAASPLNAGTLSMLASPTTGATWVTFRTGAAAGYVAVALDGIRDSGLPYGSTGIFQVVVWQGPETTWSEAYSDFKGGLNNAAWSEPLILPVTTGPSDSNVPNLIGLQSFYLPPILPEPSTGMLATGFMICLLLQKRREQKRAP